MDEAQAGLFDQARAAWTAEQWQESAACYERLLALEPDGPDSAAWWFDAALAHKFLRDWPKAYELGIQAADRAEVGTGDPAFWNLGIAATILREWEVARAAWRAYGISMTPGEGEIEGDFGLACVRVDAGGGRSEVLWARRICPTRARVTSVPFGDRRFGEIVLHDGAPNGERLVDACRYPVFDELLLWRESQTPTFRVTLACPSPDELDELWESLDDVGLTLESMNSLVTHPREESEGSIKLAREPETGSEHDVLVPGPDEATVRGLLDAWAAAGPGRAVRGLREKGPGLPSAGPGHASGDPHAVGPNLDWPFPGGVFPENLGVLAHRSLLEGDATPCYVAHDEDGWWHVYDGVAPAEPDNSVVACMRCLVEQHPRLAGLADLPPGWDAESDASGQVWDRAAIPAEDEAGHDAEHEDEHEAGADAEHEAEHRG